MMHLSQTNTKDFDELVFNDRNQAYGAYVLRKSYSSTMLKSLLIGVAFTASLLAAPYLSDLFKKEKVVDKNVPRVVTTLTTITTEKKDEKPPLPPETKKVEAPPVSTVEFRVPEITTAEIEEPLTTIDDLDGVQPGLTTQNGDPNNWGIPGECIECDQVIDQDPETVHPFVTLEQKPEYPGGEAAMWEFLGDNLEYPQHAREIHLEGKVYVTFVIDQFGTVTKVNVPREIGGGLDEEAKRVVSMMPRWSPGRQGGKAVKVAFQLPIIFKLE